MSEPPETEQESSGYMRLPLPLVGIVLFVVLAVLLAGGLYANANLRSPGVILPPTSAPAAAATPEPATSAPVAGAAGTPTVLATPAPAATATSPPQPTEAPTPLATPVIIVTEESATPIPAPEAGTKSATPLPTVEPTLAAEVGQAYENFWRVRSQAELTLDPGHAADVMDGGYLQHFLDVVSQLNQERRAIKTQVVLDYTVVQASDDVAYIHDRIEDNSYYVDPESEAPLSDPANDMEFIEFRLESSNGVWKVVDSITQD